MNWCANIFLSTRNQPSMSPRENAWLLSSCQTVVSFVTSWAGKLSLTDAITLAAGSVRPSQSAFPVSRLSKTLPPAPMGAAAFNKLVKRKFGL